METENQPELVIRPLIRFAYKLWLDILLIGSIVIGFVYITHWALFDHQIFFLLVIACMVILMIISFIYTRTMEFQIFGNEVVVKKGVINKTEKHVPYRTVTNISTRYGIFDNIFGIGTVEIETAGKTGRQSSPQEKIEGIANYVQIRNTILEELRKFRSQYTTTTEPSISKSEENIASSILDELRAIKDLLQNQQN